MVASRKVVPLFAALIAANLLAWGWALAAFHAHPALLAAALLAYSFGLRHGVDADHIAAIDNVTRKLMQDGQRPHGVGLFFALGHSSVVLVAAAVIAAGAATLQVQYPSLVAAGGVVGTALGAAFLLVIAAANAAVLAALWRLLRGVRPGVGYETEELDAILAGRGLFGRVLRRLFKLISRSWHMYPLGLLFGLGFDTATEIGVLGIAASEAVKGLPIWSILVFPALFTAGMSLVDAADGVLMLGAYGWAFADPLRKLWYNLVITGLSVLMAAVIGSAEVLGLVAERFELSGGVWGALAAAGDHLAIIGFVMICVFAAAWAGSAAIYRRLGFGKISSL